MTKASWVSVVAAAHAQKVRVIPTIMWSNGAAIQSVLSNAKNRQALETAIARLVKVNGYDGIDIDFENKLADTKVYFSLFLKGLYSRIGNKWVTCDIEARTPTDARYYGTTVPNDASVYANDYVQINKYCDRVHIMAYDQQTVDQQLAAVAASSSQLYAPVADPVWVQAVVNLAKQSINPNKIIIGVPTYGYEYEVTAYANNQYLYDILWTFDPGYALQIEQQYGVTPVRNQSGEMTLTYTPASSSTAPGSVLSSGSMGGLTAATAASLYANTYNSHLSFHLLDWSDAQSINQKIALAKALGVRGVALFEFDGGEDPAIWNILQGVKK
jgi:spore germination protein YaaH